jgi:hypothetical protein
MDRFDIDCDNQTVQLVAYTTLREDGTVVRQDAEARQPAAPATPESIAEALVRFVCQ